MVFESLFPVAKIRSKPFDMLLLSLIVSAAAVFIAWAVFTQYSGVIAPLLVTVAMTPIVYRILVEEEEQERLAAKHRLRASFWQLHGDVVWLFSLFFIGNFISIFLIAVIAPTAFVSTAFSQQLADITAIQQLTGMALTTSPLLETIIINNLRVMLFSFILSFLFATGALFILSWNASILALWLANFVRQGLYGGALIGAAGIFPHAVIEILAYFLAGIAGGILSAGVMREKLISREFGYIFKNSLIMLGFAIVAVLIGGVVEVYL